MNTPKNYRATFILNAQNRDEPTEAIIEAIQKQLGQAGATIEATENLGQKEFSRVTDRKAPGGIYVQFKITAPASTPQELQKRFALNKSVKRVFVQSTQSTLKS